MAAASDDLFQQHDVEYSGFLDKRSTHRFIGNIWTRRWCEIRGEYLIYHFKKPHYAWERTLDKKIHLAEVVNVTLMNDASNGKHFKTPLCCIHIVYCKNVHSPPLYMLFCSIY
jgi:hypothetical protein